jgi:hypothetical protein
VSDRRADVKTVFSNLGKLFFGTDKEHAQVRDAIAKDAVKVVKRVIAREGAINVVGESVDDDAPALTKPADTAVCGRCAGRLRALGVGPIVEGEGRFECAHCGRTIGQVGHGG